MLLVSILAFSAIDACDHTVFWQERRWQPHLGKCIHYYKVYLDYACLTVLCIL